MVALRLREWCSSNTLVLCIVTLILMLDSTFNLMAALLGIVVALYILSLIRPQLAAFHGTDSILPVLPEILLQLQFNDVTVNNVLSRNVSAKFVHIVRHHSLMNESMLVAIVIAGKPFAQIISNPVIGALTYEFGYSIPLFFAFLVLFFSIFLFAIAHNILILLLSRIIHGVASACTRVTGFGILAVSYPDDNERRKAMTVAFAGIAFGMLIGPVLGGSLFDILGKTSLFLYLDFLVFFGGFLQLMMIRPDFNLKQFKNKVSLIHLLKDPYIAVTTGGLFVGNVVYAVMEASLPLWMIDSMHLSGAELGAAFIPSFMTYLISIYFVLPFCVGIKILGFILYRWCRAMIGIFMLGFSQLMLPMSKSFSGIILPLVLAGFAKAIIDHSLIQQLTHLKDIPYSISCGNVYIIIDIAICFGYVVGSMISGVIMNTFGFSWLMLFVAVLCLIFAPMLVILKHRTSVAEQEVLIKKNGYSNNVFNG